MGLKFQEVKNNIRDFISEFHNNGGYEYDLESTFPKKYGHIQVYDQYTSHDEHIGYIIYYLPSYGKYFMASGYYTSYDGIDLHDGEFDWCERYESIQTNYRFLK